MTLLRTLAAIAGLAGCGDSSTDPGPCRRSARELTALLSTMNHEPAPYYVDGATMVERGGAPMVRLAPAPVVHVRRTSVVVEGTETHDFAALHDATEQMRWRMNEPLLVHVVVDEDAPWEQVVTTVSELNGYGITRPAFGFRYPVEKPTPPPRSKIDDELDAIERSDDGASKATQVADLATKAVAPCAALGKAFGAVAVDDGQSRADALIAELEPALVKCHCNVDMPSFRSLMFRVLYVAEATTSVQVTVEGAGKRVTAPASMPWRDAHARIVHGETIWLAVE